ncbi:hypothetical protein RH915_02785 [Serpentinicella sp. ANB-PHB4]|uniref:hypothetical protein n=1 Tax=Serpentinicella sp. ANB-PHB4 TaxID=3074076 RepID=UPI00285BD45D|nr:hypothetical protein [Serpentinicella sp. ANB-PHB4]MDR5658407.1 hypothetical protein [Serpentinicella sp. ANB-PHB4]
MPNSCDRIVQTDIGWQVKLLEPQESATTATTFVYELTRVNNSRQMSNIRICICPEISDADRLALLASCSLEVYFDNNTEFDCSGPNEDCCFIDNIIPRPAENPAACKGLKFDNIPSGEGDVEQERIILTLTLTQPLPIGPVTMGLKAGIDNDTPLICGPVCEEIIPPTRSIIL